MSRSQIKVAKYKGSKLQRVAVVVTDWRCASVVKVLHLNICLNCYL